MIYLYIAVYLSLFKIVGIFSFLCTGFFTLQGLKRKTLEVFGVKYKMKNHDYSMVVPVSSEKGVMVSVNVWNGSVLEDGDVKMSPVVTFPR